MQQLLKLKDVLSATRKGRSALYLDIQRGDFPKPIKIGMRSVAWQKSAVDAWLQQRIEASQVNSK